MSIDLFAPFCINGMQMQNRFMRSATNDRTAKTSGAVTDSSLTIYDTLGRGGIGLIVTGFAFVSKQGQAVYRQYGAHTNTMLPSLRKLVKAAHQRNTKIALQIAHAGINANPILLRKRGLLAMVVSKMPDVDKPQHEMTEEDIQNVINEFVLASMRGKEAGFDAVQFHAAHSLLFSQFLSPVFNHRTDNWGGTLENRRRFHLEVIRSVRKALGPRFPIMIKYGVMDDVDDGLLLREGVETAREMIMAGIDAIEISAGVGTPFYPLKKGEREKAFFRNRTAAVKRASSVPIMLVGGVRSLALAKKIVNSGDADVISMSRPFIREPGLISRWQKGEQSTALCTSCSKCSGGRGSLVCPEIRPSEAHSLT